MINNRQEDTQQEENIFAGIFIPRTLSDISQK